MTEYRDRVCAFVDILGFRSLVARSVADEELRENVLQALHLVTDAPSTLADVRLRSVVRPVLEKNAGAPIPVDIPEKDPSAVYGTAFSDSVFLSAKPDLGGILNLLLVLTLLGQRLLELGFLVRGGVARGGVVHDPGLAVGPGLIAAYELESSVAVYPRIVVSPDVLTLVREVEPLPDALMGLLREDSDGFYFLDLYELPCLRLAAYADAQVIDEMVPAYLAPVAGRLERLRNAMAGVVKAQAPTDLAKLAKINWAARAFNRSLGSKEVLLLEFIELPVVKGA